ncbi:hypothetical protein FSHL1_010359 [Fusarium sambucinum]
MCYCRPHRPPRTDSWRLDLELFQEQSLRDFNMAVVDGHGKLMDTLEEITANVKSYENLVQWLPTFNAILCMMLLPPEVPINTYAFDQSYPIVVPTFCTDIERGIISPAERLDCAAR